MSAVLLERERNDKAGKIRTFTQRMVNPLRLRSRDICIEDIAHHLSLICRYTGACPIHYSVAQHSVGVSSIVMSADIPDALRKRRSMAEIRLAALLHDAGEAYFNDLASPVKHDPRMAWYNELEHQTTRMICATFGVDPEILPYTKRADNQMFILERDSWWNGADNVAPWKMDVAEQNFLFVFNSLRSKL